MIQMQPYVKKWYDFFEEGKVMGLKCTRCGSFEFPPVTVCNNCSGTDLTWVEMSGKGKLINFTLNPYPDPPFAEFAPFFYGTVTLDEGPSYASMVLGIEEGKETELFERLPIDVTFEIQQRDGYKFIAFRIEG